MINTVTHDLIAPWHLGFAATDNAEGSLNLPPKGFFVLQDDTTISFAEMRSPERLIKVTSGKPPVTLTYDVGLSSEDLCTKLARRLRDISLGRKQKELQLC
ncbi:hypothetical protein [Thalassobius sp. Cn5-15]|uniref:hypothetical protein n=1 Tax=Thalassobius sp. Cn5-15 TaxID=2917763 RepID=UPI001EF23711|nr:hypothetical protein [Thalassobius sp. Cn5-15]MCG7492367.1 hypothetical protein [Thalassobius sp. Cn5-15]